MSITKVVSPFFELVPHTEATEGGSTFTGISSAPPAVVKTLDVDCAVVFCAAGAGFIVTPLEDGAWPP
jgi:hypothetical protein